MSYVCISISIILHISFIICDNNDNRITKTKLLSCIGISRARVKYDKDYINQVTRKVYRIDKDNPIDYYGNTKNVLSIAAGNCMQVISEEHATSLMNMIHKKKEIDPFIKEHRDFLGLEEIESNGMPINYKEKIKVVNKLLVEIEKDYKELKKNSDSGSSGIDSNNEDKEEEIMENFLSYSFDKLFLIFRILGIDGYIGLTITLFFSFICIRKLRILMTRKKYKSKNKANNNKNE